MGLRVNDAERALAAAREAAAAQEGVVSESTGDGVTGGCQ